MALPSMIFVAASRSFAFRSFILVSAISRSAERLMVPAETLPGSFEPDFSFAAFLMRKVAGGVFVSNEQLRPAEPVMLVGTDIGRASGRERWVRYVNI